MAHLLTASVKWAPRLETRCAAVQDPSIARRHLISQAERSSLPHLWLQTLSDMRCNLETLCQVNVLALFLKRTRMHIFCWINVSRFFFPPFFYFLTRLSLSNSSEDSLVRKDDKRLSNVSLTFYLFVYFTFVASVLLSPGAFSHHSCFFSPFEKDSATFSTYLRYK